MKFGTHENTMETEGISESGREGFFEKSVVIKLKTVIKDCPKFC